MDKPDRHWVDLRPYGIDCVPLIGWSRFQKFRRGTVYHVHPGCVEICLCLKGRLIFESDGACFQFFPGSVFVSNPDQPHRMRAHPKGLVIFSLLFQIPKANTPVLGLSLKESTFLVKALTHFPKRIFLASERVKKAFPRIFELYDTGKPHTSIVQLEMKTAVMDLFLALLEAAKFELPTAHSIFTDISQRMLENPQKKYPIRILAKEAALSEYAFSEAFKRAVGLPPHAWLMECRIRAAKDLLSKTNKAVWEIATAVGFSTSPHFISAFKLSTGITPLKYRRHHQKRKSRTQ